MKDSETLDGVRGYLTVEIPAGMDTNQYYEILRLQIATALGLQTSEVKVRAVGNAGTGGRRLQASQRVQSRKAA